MKIVGFDSWTGGSANFARIATALQAQGHQFTVAYIGSWGGDPDRPPSEKIDGITYRDIRSYQTTRIDAILDIEQPDAVLFLSTNTFAHRAFNRFCLKRGIPTMLLYHGLVSVQDSSTGRLYRVNPLSHMKFVLERIPKAIKHIWPTYLRCLAATGAQFSDYVRFISDIFAGAIGKTKTPMASDARTSMCCVYVPADITHAVVHYDFSPQQVVAVGNPDIHKFGLKDELIGSALNRSGQAKTDVMYIDTGLIYTGFVYKSPEEFLSHLAGTKSLLAEQGKRLIFKPHPDHYRTDMPDRLQKLGITICRNDALVDMLQDCCAAIVEPSSLAVVPALMGLPLLLTDYGPLCGQRFGSVLVNYPRAARLHTPAEFSAVLDAIEQASCQQAIEAWITDNAGPLPSQDMPDRVIQLLKNMASSS